MSEGATESEDDKPARHHLGSIQRAEALRERDGHAEEIPPNVDRRYTGTPADAIAAARNDEEAREEERGNVIDLQPTSRPRRGGGGSGGGGRAKKPKPLEARCTACGTLHPAGVVVCKCGGEIVTVTTPKRKRKCSICGRKRGDKDERKRCKCEPRKRGRPQKKNRDEVKRPAPRPCVEPWKLNLIESFGVDVVGYQREALDLLVEALQGLARKPPGEAA